MSANAIVGGLNTTADKYPWFVKVHTQLSFCGGTIIGNRTILTAAHCADGRMGNPTFVSGGGNGDIGSLQTIGVVDHVVLHPNYSSGDVTNSDLAVLVLKDPIKTSHSVMPINLSDSSFLNVSPNETLTIVGRGKTFHNGSNAVNLVMANLKMSPKAADSIFWMEVLGNDQGLYDKYIAPYGESVFFSYPLERKVGPCVGDSGGPLLIYRNKVPYLLGVMSFIRGKCGQISGYSSIPYFHKWVKSNVHL